MDKRKYNSLFHTHTVSGIVISVALYIIFFAGSFTFFMEETAHWEKGTVTTEDHKELNTNFDKVLSFLDEEGYDLYGREIYLRPKEEKNQLYVGLYTSKDSLASKIGKEEFYLEIDTNTLEIIDEEEAFYSLGNLIYFLHFFYQLPGRYGLYLAGFVAFFFLFAIVTGILIHWKKVVSNFYLFRPKVKLKLVWSDAHTVLGVIGLPFQFMYAITGVWFGIWFLLFLPSKIVIYSGDESKMYEDLGYSTKEVVLTQKSDLNFLVDPLIDKTTAMWNDFALESATIFNYGDRNMQFEIEGALQSSSIFIKDGKIRYQLATEEVLYEKKPFEPAYSTAVEKVMETLHYGKFAGKIFKICYFILGLITCFVIITGVLIWLESRKKLKITAKQKEFNQKVGYWYLAICLSMFPVTAFSFIVSKVLPENIPYSREVVLNSVFFGSWILLSAFLRYLKDNYRINKYCLLSGGVLGFLIPIVNGFTSGNWVWDTYINKNHNILLIDVLWLSLSIVSLWIVFILNRSKKVDVTEGNL